MLAVIAAMKRTFRGTARPPLQYRVPARFPLSSGKGAIPMREAAPAPSSGISAQRMAAVTGPTAVSSAIRSRRHSRDLRQRRRGATPIADQSFERLDGLRRVVLLPVAERGRLDELRPCSGQVAETELSGAARLCGVRVHHPAEACQHGRVDGVGLSQLADGLGEAPRLKRADYRDQEAVVKTPVQVSAIAARRQRRASVQHLAKAAAAAPSFRN